MQKKLMLLGGIRYLLPVIEAAHKMGVHVIAAEGVGGLTAVEYGIICHVVEPIRLKRLV